MLQGFDFAAPAAKACFGSLQGLDLRPCVAVDVPEDYRNLLYDDRPTTERPVRRSLQLSDLLAREVHEM